MKKFILVAGLVAIVAGYFAIKAQRFSAETAEYAERVSHALSQNMSDNQNHLDALVEGSSDLHEKFAQLRCDGPDLPPKKRLTHDFVYVINEVTERNRIKGWAEIEPSERLTELGSRKDSAAKLMPSLIKVCDGCELTRTYPFAIDKWKVEKKITPVTYFKKSSVVGADREDGWPKPEAQIDVLVTWEKPRFNKVGTYRQRKKKGLYGVWEDVPNSNIDAYETVLTLCVYTYGDLALIARKTIIKPPPSKHRPMSSHPDTPSGGIAEIDNDASWARTVIYEISGKIVTGKTSLGEPPEPVKLFPTLTD